MNGDATQCPARRPLAGMEGAGRAREMGEGQRRCRGAGER